MRATWEQEEQDKADLRDIVSGRQAPADRPKRDLIDWVSVPDGCIFKADTLRDVCLEFVGSANRERFEDYMSNVSNVGIITGPAGSGKTRGVAALANFRVSGAKERVVIAAHSNVAVNRSKDAFEVAAIHLITEANKRLDQNQIFNFPVMLLGTNTHDDLRVVRHIIEAKGSTDGLENLANRTSKFQLHYSLAHWLLMILEVPRFKLLDNCPSSILDIQKEMRNEPTLQPLRDFVAGKITWDAGNSRIDVAQAPKDTPNPAATTSDEDEIASGIRDRIPATRLNDMIKNAFKRIVNVAEVLFVTTSYANNDQWKSFVDSAKTVILEEAANLSLPDALQVWRKASQNVVLLGDLKQSKPWTRRRFEGSRPKDPEQPEDIDDPAAKAWLAQQETADNPGEWGNNETAAHNNWAGGNTWGADPHVDTNAKEHTSEVASVYSVRVEDDATVDQGSLKSNSRFESYILTSVMAHFILQGHPVLVFDVQYRAVNGQHDPVLDIVYKALPFTYHKSRDPLYHPEALKIEDLVTSVFDGLRPSPPGKIFPVMIDVPGSKTEVSKSKSKFNVMQGTVGMFRSPSHQGESSIRFS